LEEYGWLQPIVVDKHSVIILGHVRRLAALQLGWTEGPVHVADNLTPTQIRAYR
jgi:ParB-like chromosome segregation protein Spo0J